MRKTMGLLAVAGLFVMGCAHTPKGEGERADLTDAARKTVQDLVAKDPGLRPLLDRSVAYVVFPKVGEGGFIIGGGAGAGVVFENGQRTGFAELKHMDIGGLAGGQSYAELVIVNQPQALADLKSGRFDFGAKAQAVLMRSGASAEANFRDGVSVFIDPIKGGMVNASVGGQRIKFNM